MNPSTGAETPPRSVRTMWRDYLATLDETPESTDRTFQWWSFSDNEADADELAELVLAGTKRATAPSLWYFEESGEPVPEPGDLDVVVDWGGTARCVIRTTRVDLVPYLEVSEEFAATEGEGDGSLDYWRRVHWPYYQRELEPFGRRPEPDMPVVCQRFEVVFPPRIPHRPPLSERDARDLSLLNQNADELNREVEDILGYQSEEPFWGDS